MTMQLVFDIMSQFSGILGWFSLICYVLVITATSMKMVRNLAYLSVLNDVFYGLSLGINGLAKVVINLCVGAINSNRYAQDFTNLSKPVIYLLMALAAAGTGYIVYFGMMDLVTAFAWFKVALWADAALVIGALMVKDITKYRALLLFSCPVAIIGYSAIGETPMIIIKALVGIIASYHLIKNTPAK